MLLKFKMEVFSDKGIFSSYHRVLINLKYFQNKKLFNFKFFIFFLFFFFFLIFFLLFLY